MIRVTSVKDNGGYISEDFPTATCWDWEEKTVKLFVEGGNQLVEFAAFRIVRVEHIEDSE
ncbi:hypothetical protein LCGC14_2981710 [marine sediment metagenome]|uniref:Uncharacterized protein n=1 Tax=marine sediment metagenome TaxID=412755 RepID=A0A0F8ZXM5_9ZZZZ